MVSPRSEQVLERFVAALLRAGVLLAAALVLVGGAALLAREGSAVANYEVFRGEPKELRSVAGILADAAALQSHAIIQCGLLLLIATPVGRVVLAAAGFAWQRDGLYTGVALVVLGVLIFSLAGFYL
jgi:uncharacterized membrane protein